MKERLFPFSAPMVRALLDGTKTQTRRVIKPQPTHFNPAGVPRLANPISGPAKVIACPYGQPGDLLWVREAWHYRYSSSTPVANQFMHGVRYRADGACREVGPMPLDGVGLPKQRERNPDESWQEREDYLCAYWRRGLPSIHMPRWASRIALEITSIRVERLQDISEADAIAEGCDNSESEEAAEIGRYEKPRRAYRRVWESINGADSWDVNPWVWVVEFKRAEG